MDDVWGNILVSLGVGAGVAVATSWLLLRRGKRRQP